MADGGRILKLFRRHIGRTAQDFAGGGNRGFVQKFRSSILLGQLPLEDMDVILNMARERLEPNPESPDSDPLSYLY